MSMNQTLVLASESPYRRVLLDRLRLPYTAAAHKCDERGVASSATLQDHAMALAQAKAASLAEQFPNAHIIGSDQIAELDGEPLHKPGTEERAVEQLRVLSGRCHRLHTAIAIQRPDGTVQTAVDVHHMHMRALEPDELRRYVQADQPLDCCGSYKIESLGISLFQTIEGDDFTAITGMPMMALCRLLRADGFAIP